MKIFLCCLSLLVFSFNARADLHCVQAGTNEVLTTIEGTGLKIVKIISHYPNGNSYETPLAFRGDFWSQCHPASLHAKPYCEVRNIIADNSYVLQLEWNSTQISVSQARGLLQYIDPVCLNCGPGPTTVEVRCDGSL